MELTPTTNLTQMCYIVTSDHTISSYILWETSEENIQTFQIRKSDDPDRKFDQSLTDIKFKNGTVYFACGQTLSTIKPVMDDRPEQARI